MKQAQNMSLEQIVKIVVILAFLLLIVLVFPTKLYGAGKEIIDKAGKLFGFSKKTPIEQSTLHKHLQDTVSAMNRCMGPQLVDNTDCSCRVPFNLQNDDYAIQFSGTKAIVVDMDWKPIQGLESSVDGVICLFDYSAGRVWHYPPDGDYPMVLRYREITDPRLGIEDYSMPSRRASVRMNGQNYGVSLEMFRFGDRHLCFATDAYTDYQYSQGNYLGSKPECK